LLTKQNFAAKCLLKGALCDFWKVDLDLDTAENWLTPHALHCLSQLEASPILLVLFIAFANKLGIIGLIYSADKTFTLSIFWLFIYQF
jgi:hypothetical protein